MVTEPRRQRRSRPEPAVPAPAAYRQPASEWRVRLAMALLAVSAVSALANLLALLALGGAIANLGAPQGPLEFAVVFVGSVLGLGGDGLIVSGTLGALQPQLRLVGRPATVTAGLVLQLPAAAAVGVLQSSWLFAVIYLLMVAGLAVLWVRTAPPAEPVPVARHVLPEPVEQPRPEPLPSYREPIPWVGSTPPPPSASASRPGGSPSPGPARPPSGRRPGR